MTFKLVERFGDVRNNHFSEHMNKHLEAALRDFDTHYEIHGGVLNSQGHNEDREKFIRFVSEGLLRDIDQSDLTTYWSRTNSEYIFGSCLVERV